jgi:DNA-binding MarR family transcriptional regulator
VQVNHDQTADVPDISTPQRPEGLGLGQSLMEDVLLRRAVLEGRTPMTTLADKLHISINVVEALLNSLRHRKLIEYDGMEGRAYRIAVTEAGHELAHQRSRESRYAGPMPVPLELYAQVVRAQRPNLHLDREMLARSFSDLVIAPDLLDQLGPAIHGEGAIFLYGPPGTGKSSVAERVVRAYGDTVLVPYCLEVDGQIVSVFDPTLHTPVDEHPPGVDRRWVACLRPAVVAGGELHAGMLDLQLDRDTGVYLAPLQLKANNGVLVIDDFGRQAMSPEALLNRWIVPLDRAIDYLTLHGRKIEVPFEVKAVLSTNLDPSQLGDEAFFRRIHNKVYIGACTDDQFDWILARVAGKRSMEVDASAAARLREVARARGDGELRAYLPGVVCELAQAIISYENLACHITPALVDRVLDLYFTKLDDDDAPSGGASMEQLAEADRVAPAAVEPPVVEPALAEHEVTELPTVEPPVLEDPEVATPVVGGHEPVLPTPAPVDPAAVPAPPPFRSDASI